MPIIEVEQLGQVEIAGETPTPQEQRQITEAIRQKRAQSETQERRSFLSEAIPQVVGGVRDAAQNLLNLAVNRPAAFMQERFPAERRLEITEPKTIAEFGGFKIESPTFEVTRRPFEPLTLPPVKEPETTAGSVTRGLSQFFVPYLGAMKIIGRGQTAFQMFAKAEGTAVLTEQAVFDPFEERLSDLVQQFPALQNPVTEFLQSDPDDSEAEARLKLAAESTGLGMFAGSIIGAIRGLRRLKRGESKEALEDIQRAERELPQVADPPSPETFLGPDARMMDRAANINLNRIDSTDEIKSALQTTAETFGGRIEDARRGTIRDEQLRQLAQESGVSVDDLLSRREGEAFNAEQILSARYIMAQSADNLLTAAKKAADSGLEEDLIAYRNALNVHVAVQEQVSGLAAEAGRALSQFRNVVGADVDEFLRQAGGRNNLREGAAMLSQLDDIGQITRAAKELDKPTITDKFLEVWINGLLSGPQTHAVNALSNTLTSLWTIPEHFLAAGIGAARRTPDRETFTEAFSRVYGWAQGAREGFTLARRAFLTEEPSDLFSKLELRRPQAIGGRTGQIVRLPGRALISSDEFFKSIGHRMELNAAATRDALQAGLQPRTREFAEHVQKFIDNPPENVQLQAIENARYLTFTKKLEGVSRHITSAQTELPALRLIMPFVRTPTNIVRFAGERTPFGVFMREFRNSKGAARDAQIAKITLGSMAGATIAGLAAEGKVTGSGPSDPQARQALRDTGWQPYSFVIDTPQGKRYLAFQRVEPLGILFGVAADFAEIAGQMNDEERDNLASRISAAVSQNLTDKTFFKGLSDAIEAINDPDRFMDIYVQNFAGTAVPTGVAQVTRTVDPILRDTRSMMDRIKSRIPGYSDDLPARRNLWGEPIVLGGGLGPDLVSPIYSSFATNDPVSNELVRLDLFPSLPQRKLGGEEIPPKMYWAYVENAGKPAHRQLEQLVNSQEWKELDQFPETQRSIIRDIVQENRDVARTILRLNMGKVLSDQERRTLEQFGIDTEQIEQRVAQ